MSKLQKINSVVTGALMLAFSIMLFVARKDGYYFIVGVISTMMVIGAVGMLWYYFRLARFMVGGRYVLYQGVIFLDLGLFTFSLTDVPLIYIILYLIVINAVAGAIDMGLAINARRTGSPSWKLKFSAGFVELGMAALCLLKIHSTDMVVIIYAIGVAYAGLVRIVSAFRNTETVYIQ